MFSLRMLVVERSKGVQTFVRQLFENFGFDAGLIRTADSPQAALRLASALKPDFLLTEWFFGEPMTGIALYEKVWELNPACRFALLSDDTGAQRTEAAQQAGAVFLQKTPCTAADLRTALGQALQLLAAENPALNGHVDEVARNAASHLATLKFAATARSFASGDRVLYRGSPDTVKHVILRQGGLMVQLAGQANLVHVDEVRLA